VGLSESKVSTDAGQTTVLAPDVSVTNPERGGAQDVDGATAGSGKPATACGDTFASGAAIATVGVPIVLSGSAVRSKSEPGSTVFGDA
jgi:hypothetical protein